MPQRRTVLKLWPAGLLTWMGLGAAPASASAAPIPVQRGLYLVGGWLLSDTDLKRLGLNDR